MKFEAQEWNGNMYTPIGRADNVSDLDSVRARCNGHATRVVSLDRDKRLPLRPKFRKRYNTRSNLDSIDLNRQAQYAAEHLTARGPGPVHVFPCGGTGHSNDFRYFLALAICGAPRKYGDDWNGRRRRNEAACAEAGFPFVEVDPEDFR